MNLSDDDIFADIFADRLRPKEKKPGSDNDNEMLNYKWNELDSGTFHNFQNAAAASDAAADQAARAEAIRAQAQARLDAQVQAGATPVAQMNQRYKLKADRVPNCEEIRNAYFYYGQSPDVQDVINRFIASARPGTHPPFDGDSEKAAKAAAAWQQQLGRRGGYKSKSKSMKYRKRKSKSMKYRKRKSKSMKCRKRKSNRRTMRT
jgi:hypothetical protein